MISTPYSAVQFCTVQISTPVQCCSVLYSADQYPRTVLFSFVRCRSVPPYSVVQYCTVQIGTSVQCCSVRYSMSQCICTVMFSGVQFRSVVLYSECSVFFSVCTEYISQVCIWECQQFFRPEVYNVNIRILLVSQQASFATLFMSLKVLGKNHYHVAQLSHFDAWAYFWLYFSK